MPKRARDSDAGGGAIAVVNDAASWASLREKNDKLLKKAGYFSYYSSKTDAITTNPALMHVPIDDHAIVRGHAVFDTCSLNNKRMYRLQIHLDRLFASCKAARLPLPFGEDEGINRTKMTEIVRETCKASKQTSCDVRFWVSAGTGNLGVTPSGCTPSFYVLCFGGLPGLEASDGIAEVSISSDVVPLKPKHLAELKSNNYMLNALTMMAAKDRGGHFGLGVDSDGFLTESCVLNVAVLGKDKILRTPPFEGILKGTTVRKCMDLANRHLVAGKKGAGGGLIKKVSQEKIRLKDALQAAEIFFVAGDTHTFAITTLDGKKIGDGKVGPVFNALTTLLQEDAKKGEDDHEPL